MDHVIFSREFFGSFNNFVDYKYVLGDNAFTRSGKVSLASAIKYPLLNTKKTTTIEANKFIRQELGDSSMTLTKQGISDRMQYIDPQVYIDMNNAMTSKIYSEADDLDSFKDFKVFAIDGSIIELPNIKLTREEFGINNFTLLKKHTTSARISCMSDVKTNYIISSNIAYKGVHEIEHALYHLEDVKDRIDLSKVITIYDRGYPSTEIMLKTILLNSYFVMRAKTITFKHEQSKMKTNDETFEIKLNNPKINRFHNEELKKIAQKIPSIKIRIVKVKLKNGIEETLITNLPKETATPEELKQLYGDRWTIETNYEKLKNKLQIEKFSGRKKIRIEQDFYSDILIFNLLMTVKHDADQKIKRKPKKSNKYEYKYQTNFNTLTGQIKEMMPYLLTDNQEQINQIMDNIIEIASKDLVYTKINPPTNKERDKKRYSPKKCKSNLKQSF